MTLADLAQLLAEYAEGLIPLDTLQARFQPLLASDPLGAEHGDDARWAADHEAERLFWRLLYLYESQPHDTPEARRLARRVVRCLSSTGNPGLTFELLPLLLDEERFRAIVDKHRRGIISRTGWLSVLAESGYAPHAKLWLQHAPLESLEHFAALLGDGRYADAAAMLERAPG